VAPTALVVVLKWLVTYSYKNLVWHHLEFFYYKNVATNLVDVVKFVAPFLYLEGKMFGFKGVAFVVFQILYINSLESICDGTRVRHRRPTGPGPALPDSWISTDRAHRGGCRAGSVTEGRPAL
jgi:hypothetical protein